MSNRGGRQKQMMHVVPPVTPAQRQPPPPQQRQPPPQQQRLQVPQQQQQQQQQRQPPPQEKQQKPKMTIGDAIGLITIRLGRVEQFIQQLQTDGIDINSINSTQPNDFMDNGLIQNLVSRLNTIEEYSADTSTAIAIATATASSASSSAAVAAAAATSTAAANEQRIKNMETDLKDTKDLLIKLMLKFEIFSDDTHAKFEDQQHQIAFNLEQLQQEPIKDLYEEQVSSEEQVSTEETLPTPSNESEPVP